MTSDTLRAIREALDRATAEDRKAAFDSLRKEFPIHELERKWNVDAEIVLAAIARASDFTQRGVRGVIAEACFEKYIIMPRLSRGWNADALDEDYPYDFKIKDDQGEVTIQVKNQRMALGQPKLWRPHTPKIYDAETDKSRKGEKDGEQTRRYRYGEFDLLAVCMQPLTDDWTKFLYTVGNWLLPRQKDPKSIGAHQPIDPSRTDEWTDDFDKAVAWFRSGARKTITAPAAATRRRTQRP
jgi:hypothetical protein